MNSLRRALARARRPCHLRDPDGEAVIEAERGLPCVAAVAVIGGLALSIRLILAGLTWRFNPDAMWLFDSNSYHVIACHLLSHSPLPLLTIPAHLPFAQRPIGYPMLIAGLYAIVGTHPFAVVSLQILLSSATVMLTFLVGRAIFGDRVGMLGGLLLAADPASVGSSLLLLTETSFTFLLILSLWLLVRGFSARTGIGWFAGAGLSLALATHVRPVSYYLIPLMGIVVLLIYSLRGRTILTARRRWRAAIVRSVAFSFLPLLLVGGWQVLRFARTGNATFCGIEGVNMLFYRGAGVLAIRDGKSVRAEQEEMGFSPPSRRSYTGYFTQHPEAVGLSTGALSARWTREGWAIIRRYPLAALVIELRGIAQMFFDPATFELSLFMGLDARWLTGPITRLLQHAPAQIVPLMSSLPADAVLLILGLLYLIGLYAGIAVFLARTPRSEWRIGTLLVVGTLLYFVIVAAGPEANARFRVPIMPLIVLIASAGWRRLSADGAAEAADRRRRFALIGSPL